MQNILDCFVTSDLQSTSFQDWSIESFDMFWIQQNPTIHQKQDWAHTSLSSELKILSKASDQRVAEKALLLQKLLKVSLLLKKECQARLFVSI